MGAVNLMKSKGESKMLDKRTGEEIKPFGYSLDGRGRIIRGRIDLSKPSHDTAHKLTVCYQCNGALDELERCANCYTGE